MLKMNPGLGSVMLYNYSNACCTYVHIHFIDLIPIIKQLNMKQFMTTEQKNIYKLKTH